MQPHRVSIGFRPSTGLKQIGHFTSVPTCSSANVVDKSIVLSSRSGTSSTSESPGERIRGARGVHKSMIGIDGSGLAIAEVMIGGEF
jgi:hypothetical protein